MSGLFDARAVSVSQPMKNRLIDDAAALQMLDDDALQQRGRDASVPDAIGVHDHDRATSAHAQTRRLAALHAIRPEEQSLALQQRGQETVQLLSAPIGRAET